MSQAAIKVTSCYLKLWQNDSREPELDAWKKPCIMLQIFGTKNSR